MSEERLIAGLLDGMPPPGQVPVSFGNQEVGDEDISILLSAARVAPSADNAQIWRFITVRDPEKKRRLGEAAGEGMAGAFSRASVVMVACGVRFIVTRTRKEQPFAVVDVPIGLLQILLQARELNLSFTWTLDCDEPAVRKALGIPQDVRVVSMVAF